MNANRENSWCKGSTQFYKYKLEVKNTKHVSQYVKVNYKKISERTYVYTLGFIG